MVDVFAELYDMADIIVVDGGRYGFVMGKTVGIYRAESRFGICQMDFILSENNFFQKIVQVLLTN